MTKNSPSRDKSPFAYSLNKKIRGLAMRAMCTITGSVKKVKADLHRERFEKILLVRSTFRMGSSILATPAIFLFRRNFPHAMIDFVDWFNVTIPRPAETNKYRVLPTFLSTMGIETQPIFPQLILSSAEKEDGRGMIETLVTRSKPLLLGFL